MYDNQSTNPWKDFPRREEYYGPEGPKTSEPQRPTSMKPLIGLVVIAALIVALVLAVTFWPG